jgi:uncharacterized protein (DUF433 family)
MSDFTRITQNPAVMGGKPCIRGLRVTVGMLVGQIGGGRTVDELLADYPYLEREDISEALRYAAIRELMKLATTQSPAFVGATHASPFCL